MKPATDQALSDLLRRRPEMALCEAQIRQGLELLVDSQRNGGKLLVCGNGGSAADSMHIVGELVKSFAIERPLSADLKSKLKAVHPEQGNYLAENLCSPIRAMSLVCEVSLITAVMNDTFADLVFAQQVLAHGRSGDLLMAISTSGSSVNVLNACLVARALEMKLLALTGGDGGKLSGISDCTILAPGSNTPEIQEAHLPIYHTLCRALELELTDDYVPLNR